MYVPDKLLHLNKPHAYCMWANLPYSIIPKRSDGGGVGGMKIQ